LQLQLRYPLPALARRKKAFTKFRRPAVFIFSAAAQFAPERTKNHVDAGDVRREFPWPKQTSTHPDLAAAPFVLPVCWSD
jgi:hypothetical protein